MYNKCNRKTLVAIAYANREAKVLHSPNTKTEHVLLAILRDPDAIATKILNRLKLDYVKAIVEVDNTSKADSNEETPNQHWFTKFLNTAWDYAQQNNCNQINTGHLLGALITDEYGLAGKVLRNFDISLEKYNRVLSQLSAQEMQEN